MKSYGTEYLTITRRPTTPQVSVGWDNSVRGYKHIGHIIKNATPENFEAALRKARSFVDKHPGQVPLITVNSWNEWTETSYLMQDTLHGYGHLEAIKRVFVDEEE